MTTKQIIWSDYVLYAEGSNIIIKEEKGDFNARILFNLTVEEIRNLEFDKDKKRYKNIQLTEQESKQTFWFGKTKSGNRLILTRSLWGEYLPETKDFAESKYDNFITSEGTLTDILSGNLETDDGGVYRKTLFTFE